MIERLLQLVCPCLHFLEQASIIYGDDRLISERLNEVDPSPRPASPKK
jgi:hypothetical protein